MCISQQTMSTSSTLSEVYKEAHDNGSTGKPSTSELPSPNFLLPVAKSSPVPSPTPIGDVKMVPPAESPTCQTPSPIALPEEGGVESTSTPVEAPSPSPFKLPPPHASMFADDDIYVAPPPLPTLEDDGDALVSQPPAIDMLDPTTSATQGARYGGYAIAYNAPKFCDRF